MSNVPVNPKVSVIIPIYGKAGDLPRLIDALQAQTLKPHEIILVDSSPKPIDNPPPGTRLVKNPVDVALSWDYNLGAKEATGDYVLNMQQDCVPEDKAALELLRRSPTAQQGEMVAAIEKDDPQLAGELRTQLFTFDDLEALSDRDIQQVLKETDMQRLTVALKGASSELREKFLRNLSKRAAEMLAEDLNAMGAVKLAAVEEAQAEVARIALSLAEEEKITIVRPADKMV